jgi:hypothetical protein
MYTMQPLVITTFLEGDEVPLLYVKRVSGLRLLFRPTASGETPLSWADYPESGSHQNSHQASVEASPALVSL